MDGPELQPARKRPRADVPAEAVPPADVAASGDLGGRFAALEHAVRAMDARLDVVERQSRAALEQLRADVLAGFQEAASRTVVLAEATDEVLDRIEGRLVDAAAAAAEPVVVEPPPPPVDLGPVEIALAELRALVAAIPIEHPPPPPPPPVPERVDLAPLQALLERVEDRVQAAEPGWEEIRRRVADLAVAVIALQPTIDAIVDLRSHVDLVAGRLSDLLGGPSLTELMDRLDEIADRETDAGQEPGAQ